MGILLADKKVLDHADDVFYLRLDELLDPGADTHKNLYRLVEKRKEEYVSYKEVTPPPHFSTIDNQLPSVVSPVVSSEKTIYARPASPGVVKGKVRVFKEFTMPAQLDFDILVTSHTDPGWTSLIALSKGLIIEHGGVLSHASIVARELGIPAVIGASHAVDTLTDYQTVEIDGSTGIIKLL
jgi:pyruvate,water dikinase